MNHASVLDAGRIDTSGGAEAANKECDLAVRPVVLSMARWKTNDDPKDEEGGVVPSSPSATDPYSLLALLQGEEYKDSFSITPV